MPVWFFLLLLYIGTSGSSGTNNPGPRSSAGLIYFPPAKRLLLVDGFVIHPGGGKNEIWSWDGERWQRLEKTGPASKTLSSGGYDTRTRQVVMFGGIGEKGYSNLFGDVWAFNGEGWNQIKTNSIGTRDHHKMLYAEHLNGFVMYGGQDSLRKFDSATWILQRSTWKTLHIPGPGSRYHFGLCYDPARKKVVLYGGYSEKGIRSDTWEFDGNRWVQIKADGPGPRGRISMCYDSDRKMVVLFGGDLGKKKVDTRIQPDGEIWDLRGDLWGFDGKKWKLLSDNGPRRMMSALGYDPLRKKLVLYGGGGELQEIFADTWEFSNGNWEKKDNEGAWKWNGKEYEKTNNQN